MRDEVTLKVAIDRDLNDLLMKQARAKGVSPAALVESALNRELAMPRPEQRFTAYMRLARRF